MSAKSKGTAAERFVVSSLREKGWWAMRSPASLGMADVVALKRAQCPTCGHDTEGLVQAEFWEVKANRKGGPYKNFSPARRTKFRGLLTDTGASGGLCHTLGGKVNFIYSPQFP